jgi:hypothetical protein
MLPTKFRFICQSGFREDFLEINQSDTRIAFGGHMGGSVLSFLKAELKVSDIGSAH